MSGDKKSRNVRFTIRLIYVLSHRWSYFRVTLLNLNQINNAYNTPPLHYRNCSWFEWLLVILFVLLLLLVCIQCYIVFSMVYVAYGKCLSTILFLIYIYILKSDSDVILLFMYGKTEKKYKCLPHVSFVKVFPKKHTARKITWRQWQRKFDRIDYKVVYQSLFFLIRLRKLSSLKPELISLRFKINNNSRNKLLIYLRFCP